MIKKLFTKAQGLVSGTTTTNNEEAIFSKSMNTISLHEAPDRLPRENTSSWTQSSVPEHVSAPAVAQTPTVSQSSASRLMPVSKGGKYCSPKDLTTKEVVTFCPGCGDFAILMALKNAISQMDIPQEQFVIVCGIGCHGHTCNFVHTYNFEGLHGRPIPVAEGIKMANNKLKVIVVAGDGDTYGEGLNHFMMALRGNPDITLIVHDNRIYGLTTGQTSPTCEKGFVSKSTPTGVIEEPLNPMAVGIANHGSFLARSFCGNIPHMTNIFVQALSHNGFSVVDVLQNCVSFNKVNTLQWYNERVYELGPEYDPRNKEAAFAKAIEFGDRIPLGILYQDDRESYQDAVPEIKDVPLTNHPTNDVDLTATFEKYC